MKKNIIYYMLAIATLIITGCQNNEFNETLAGENERVINLVIPQFPTTGTDTRVSWGDADNKSQWEEGDKLYIYVGYSDEDNFLGDINLTAIRSGGQWVFSNTLQAPAGSKFISIGASYVIEYNNNPAVNSVVLDSFTDTSSTTGSIVLDPFTHSSTRLTFTGLTSGDEVSFREYNSSSHPWGIPTITYDSQFMTDDIPMLTADVNGVAEVYVEINAENKNCNFRINGLPSNTWYTFSPGIYPEGKSDYWGQHYIIDCSGLNP